MAWCSVNIPGSKIPLRAVSKTGLAAVAPMTTASPATRTAVLRLRIRAPKTALTIFDASLRPTSMQSQTSNAKPRKTKIVIRSTRILSSFDDHTHAKMIMLAGKSKLAHLAPCLIPGSMRATSDRIFPSKAVNLPNIRTRQKEYGRKGLCP